MDKVFIKTTGKLIVVLLGITNGIHILFKDYQPYSFRAAFSEEPGRAEKGFCPRRLFAEGPAAGRLFFRAARF
jgi:hypothetical protein